MLQPEVDRADWVVGEGTDAQLLPRAVINLEQLKGVRYIRIVEPGTYYVPKST